MGFFSKKDQTLFNVARAKVNSLTEYFDETSASISLEKNKWFQIIPDDPKSPMLMGMGTNAHLIYYPENSTPYKHSFEGSFKSVEILSGEVWDLTTGKKFVKGDKITITPETVIEPFTRDKEAYVRVLVTKVDTIWTKICD